jgi:WD40 repeat protein
MPRKATNSYSCNITNNHSEKYSSDSSNPIDDRTVRDTTVEVEENHRLVWEEDCSSSNVDSLSDLGFVPSDFDPTPLDKLLSSSTSDQEEEEVEQLYEFRALLDSLEGIDDFTFPPTSNEQDSSNFNTYGSLDTSVDGEELSIHSTSDFASVHSDIFESSWYQYLEDLEALQNAFSFLTTRDKGQICTSSVVGKEEETSSNTNRPSKLTMSDETEIINRDVTCNNVDITTDSGGCNAVNEEETAEKSSLITEAQHFIRAFQNEKKTQRSFLGHKETIFSVKFSSCQRFVATASQEATIKLWNVKSNRCVATLTGHHREYECLRVAW